MPVVLAVGVFQKLEVSNWIFHFVDKDSTALPVSADW